MRRQGAMALAVVVLGVLAGGCGGSDQGGGGGGGGGGGDQGGGAEAGLSQGELVKQTNAICTRHAQTISAAANKLLAGGNLPNPKQFGQLAQETIVPQVTAQIKELRALKPPGDTAAKYGQWLDDSDAALGKVKKDPRVITDPSTFKAVNGEADGLGLSKDCHIGPDLG